MVVLFNILALCSFSQLSRYELFSFQTLINVNIYFFIYAQIREYELLGVRNAKCINPSFTLKNIFIKVDYFFYLFFFFF